MFVSYASFIAQRYPKSFKRLFPSEAPNTTLLCCRGHCALAFVRDNTTIARCQFRDWQQATSTLRATRLGHGKKNGRVVREIISGFDAVFSRPQECGIQRETCDDVIATTN